ncbi:MAG: anti-sigma factor, partial [Parafilimonas terrae]|nr:anti-sigma factor [Parafilimonas terrae]
MTDSDEDDLLAAEFALGTLGVDERRAAEERRASDRAFDAAVSDWENRLSGLLAAVPSVVPSTSVYHALERRLFGAAEPVPRGGAEIIALTRSLRRWRLATAAATGLAASILAWAVVSRPPAPVGGHFVAVLQKDAGAPAIVLDVDVGARQALVRPVAASEPADKSLELWLINPEAGGPRSLGTLSPSGVTRASLASYDPAVIA